MEYQIPLEVRCAQAKAGLVFQWEWLMKLAGDDAKFITERNEALMKACAGQPAFIIAQMQESHDADMRELAHTAVALVENNWRQFVAIAKEAWGEDAVRMACIQIYAERRGACH